MRINPMQQNDIITSYMNNVTKVAPDAAQARHLTNDSVELSSGAKEYAQLVKAAREAMSASDVKEDQRANAIMGEINSGQYQYELDDVAQSIVNASNIPLMA